MRALGLAWAWVASLGFLALACGRKPAAPEVPSSETPSLAEPVPKAARGWEAAAACPSGLEVPPVDPRISAAWDVSTGPQQAAVLRSPAHEHWSRVASRGPIAIVDGDTLRLQSVDGCWSQVLPEAPPSTQVAIDGPNGLLWLYGPEGLSVIELVPAPAEPVEVIDATLMGQFRIEYQEDPPQSLGGRTLRSVVLSWGSSIAAFGEALDGRPREDVALTDAGKAWLAARTERLQPGVRQTEVPLRPSTTGSTPEPTLPCAGQPSCGHRQPLGSFGLHRVVVGSLLERGDAEDGDACLLWDASAKAWRSQVDGEPLGPDADLLEEAEPCDAQWLIDPSGRAVSSGGRLCTAADCRWPGGTVLGFVRGTVELGGTVEHGG